VFENRVLRRIFAKEEVVGCWRRLYNEELHKLYALPENYMGDEVEEERDRAYIMRWWDEKCRQILVRKYEREEPLGRPRCRW
jgi:hypothetical protein